MTSRKIHIFKSLEEQEEFHKNRNLQSTWQDRFRRLLQMQQFNKMMHPQAKNERRIIIHHGHTE